MSESKKQLNKPVVDDEATSYERSESKAEDDNPTKSEDHVPGSVFNSFLRRFFTGTSLTSFCIILMFMGHIYIQSLVMIVVCKIQQEILQLKNVDSLNINQPMKRVLEGIVLIIVLLQYFDLMMDSQADQRWWILQQQHLIAQVGILFVIVAFVVQLKRNHGLRQQFNHLSWMISACLVIVPVLQTSSIMFEGMIWFMLPVALVVTNDVAAYCFGMMLGRKIFNTPLIDISPKKTWEGYLFGGIFTICSSYFWGWIWQESLYMTCKVDNIQFLPFENYNMNCVQLEMFTKWNLYDFRMFEISLTGFQAHAIVLSTFASSIAPFGGFFASGLKRAFKIKDFGSELPGHGGFTDRFDCQMIMISFAYIQYQQIIGIYNSFRFQQVKGSLKKMNIDELRQVQILVSELCGSSC